ncbi:MAG: TetR/AcrR family transcriptional regulator [Bacillota bacterium]
MFETFEKLPESKRNQILQVCVEEFVQKGYGNASTNTIVKRLGISKGVLFLYFKNKKNIYLYLVEYITKILVDDFFGQFTDFSGNKIISIDIFDNLGEYYKVLIQEKPEFFLFMLEAFLNTPAELKEDVESRHHQAHGSILNSLKTAGFREGIDLQMVIDLLHMVSFHVGQLIFKDYNGGNEQIKVNIDSYVEIYTKYVDIIKYGVYER